jgi:hypothetical protein
MRVECGLDRGGAEPGASGKQSDCECRVGDCGEGGKSHAEHKREKSEHAKKHWARGNEVEGIRAIGILDGSGGYR